MTLLQDSAQNTVAGPPREWVWLLDGQDRFVWPRWEIGSCPELPRGPWPYRGAREGWEENPRSGGTQGPISFHSLGHDSAGQRHSSSPSPVPGFAMPCPALHFSCQFSPIHSPTPTRPANLTLLPDSCPLKGQKASLLLLCVVVFPLTVRKHGRSEQRRERSSAFPGAVRPYLTHKPRWM